MYAYNYYFYNVGTILPAPANFTFFPGITPLPIQLTCDVTSRVAWIVNGQAIVFYQLASYGYDYNGYNILINNPKNNSEYICANGRIFGKPFYIFVAGKYVRMCIQLCV